MRGMMDKLAEEVATLKENARWQNKVLETIQSDVKDIKDSHLSFKWKIVGASSIVGFLASLLVEMIRR